MIPYDGFGYGKSIYWHVEAKSIAKANNEDCFCWGEDLPRLIIKSKDGSLRTVKVKIGCYLEDGKLLKCRSFSNTELALSEKFKEFYK